MRGRRRITVIHGAGALVKESFSRGGITYHLRKASLYPPVKGAVEAIYSVSGVPAEPRTRKRKLVCDAVDTGTLKR